MNRTITENSVKVLQSVILLGCTMINRYLWEYPKAAAQAQQYLGNLPFVLMDDGAFVYPSNVIYDLEKDLSSDARSPPEYLESFTKFLQLVGSPTVKVTANMPKVQLVAENCAKNLKLAIRNSFNDPTLSDIRFVFCDGRTIHCHKLVLGLNSEVFRAMFTSGMKEGTFKDNGTAIQAPDWVQYDGLYNILQYFYTGKIEGGHFLFYPHSEYSTSIVCCMLRLADQYFLDFVKQW
jgi:hypothetical protein